MPYSLVRLKSQDFAKFKTAFDGIAADRKAATCKSERLFRSSTDPNEAVVLLEWGDVNKARQFYQSAPLRDALQRSGVTYPLDVSFIDEVVLKGA